MVLMLMHVYTYPIKENHCKPMKLFTSNGLFFQANEAHLMAHEVPEDSNKVWLQSGLQRAPRGGMSSLQLGLVMANTQPANSFVILQQDLAML